MWAYRAAESLSQVISNSVSDLLSWCSVLKGGGMGLKESKERQNNIQIIVSRDWFTSVFVNEPMIKCLTFRKRHSILVSTDELG